MKNIKVSKKFIKIVAIVFVFFMILNVALSGINTVPKEYRNIPVSFLTPDLDWCSRPSDVILRYGLPQEISGMNSETGSINYQFEFDYEGKKIEFIAFTRYFPNGRLYNCNFYIDCKTPEEAEKFFNESHKKMLELYGDEEMFTFDDYEPLDLDETDDTKNSCGKEYSIRGGAIGVHFYITYTENDPIVFVKSHFQY